MPKTRRSSATPCAKRGSKRSASNLILKGPKWSSAANNCLKLSLPSIMEMTARLPPRTASTESENLVRLIRMSAIAKPPQKEWTEAELQALPEDGFVHDEPKNNWFHGRISLHNQSFVRIRIP